MAAISVFREANWFIWARSVEPGAGGGLLNDLIKVLVISAREEF